MNFSVLFSLATRRIRSSACDTSTVTVSSSTPVRLCARDVLCWSAFPLVTALGSTCSAADCSALFAGFTATMAMSDFPRSCIIGYGSSPSRCGPSCRTARWPNVGSPSFRYDLCERDLAFDPGGTTVPRKAAQPILRSTVETVSAPSEKDISWLNPRPHAPAVYASCATLPPPHTTLATGRLARPYPGRTCTGRSHQLTLAPSSTHPTIRVRCNYSRAQMTKTLVPSLTRL